MSGVIKFVIGLNIFSVRKSGITDSINHNFAIFRIDSYNSLPTEKILTFHNVKILLSQLLIRIKIITIIYI